METAARRGMTTGSEAGESKSQIPQRTVDFPVFRLISKLSVIKIKFPPYEVNTRRDYFLFVALKPKTLEASF